MNTTESSSGDLGRKAPASFRHGEPGASAATAITAPRSTVTARATPRPGRSLGSRVALTGDRFADSAAEVSSSLELSPWSSSSTCSVGTPCRVSRGSTTRSMTRPAMTASTSEDAS